VTAHTDLVRRAVAWLRRGVPQPLSEVRLCCMPVFGEITTAASETPDAIGWAHGCSIVVECKVSRADFRADMRKVHAREPTSGMGRYQRGAAWRTPLGVVFAWSVWHRAARSTNARP